MTRECLRGVEGRLWWLDHWCFHLMVSLSPQTEAKPCVKGDEAQESGEGLEKNRGDSRWGEPGPKGDIRIVRVPSALWCGSSGIRGRESSWLSSFWVETLPDKCNRDRRAMMLAKGNGKNSTGMEKNGIAAGWGKKGGSGQRRWDKGLRVLNRVKKGPRRSSGGMAGCGMRHPQGC